MIASVTLPSKRRKLEFLPVAFVVLVTVAAVYSPMTRAELIWEDKIWFYKEAWLREGDAWKHFLFHGFFEWTNYFRPLVVALFTFEVRFFQNAPQLTHIVSLAIHLTNTLLVGLLARRMCAPPGSRVSSSVAGVAMALYGLHPALIEPIAWVTCQFDLVVILFILLGLLLHISAVRPGLRAAGVAACFFLAACAKEFAISMPMLLLLGDLTRLSKEDECPWPVSALRAIWNRQKTTYVLAFITGLAYLALRYWSLGFLTAPNLSETLPSLARFQTVCFIYVHYLRVAIWPMLGLGPFHFVDTRQFLTLSLTSVATDAAAVATLAGAILLAYRRKMLGFLVLAASAALFPALHIIPVAFDSSLYHERYAMPAIAMICVWLPGLLPEPSSRFVRRGAALVVPIAAACWLGVAILNIAVTLPLWGDDVKLWQWVAREQPDSIDAQDHLLSTYIERNDPRAQPLADRIIAEHLDCSNCWLNAAYLAVNDGDVSRAEAAVKLLQHSPDLGSSDSLMSGYMLVAGQLLELQHDLGGSEQAYNSAIKIEPYDPQPAYQLALLLAREGRTSEAKIAEGKAIALIPPGERPRRQGYFEQALNHPEVKTSAPLR
jgi:tetratricopeptide (TPR) repeat protein